VSAAPALREYEGLPVLDFKFRNTGPAGELLTRVVVDVAGAAVDPTPSLEYGLACRDGDLIGTVRNHGWGAAERLTGTVDLSLFGAAVPADEVEVDLGSVQPGRHRRCTLVGHRDLVPAKLPPGLTVPPTEPFREPPGGIDDLPGLFDYRSTDGTWWSDEVTLSRIERDVYDLRKIYVADGRFHYVEYDLGVMYSLLPPSCAYHFRLDPEGGPQTYERSVAHVVGPDEYERIWLLFAAPKSGVFELTCRFHSATRLVAETPPIRLHVWSPRDHPLHDRGAHVTELSEIAFPNDYRGAPRRLPDYDH
jgi:hypothetical protein